MMQIAVIKDGRYWDGAKFVPDHQMSAGAAVMDALSWRRKILREEPEATVRLEIRVDSDDTEDQRCPK